MKRGLALSALLGVSVSMAGVALADAQLTVDDYPVTLAWSGFVRADYGNGNRYSVADGEDRLGFTKSLLLLSATTQDIQAILDFGGTGLSQQFGGSDIGIKDAFIVIGAGNAAADATGFSLSAGAQPLLFGLRPNGYPSDSSLQPNIDYGNNGAFAVSQQAGPAVIGVYKFTPDISIRFGVFDLAESNTGNTTTAGSGSKIGDNNFVLLRGGNLGGTGLYGTLGFERIYVGVTGGPLGTQGGGPVGGTQIDDSKNIYSGGIGYKQGIFDASVEFIHLDAAIVNTQSSERYIRAHVAVNPAPEWTAYADYSNGNQLGASDYRIGGVWQFRKHLAFTAEYSKDVFKSSNSVYNGLNDVGINPVTGSPNPYGTTPSQNLESVDLRLTFSF
jgi:hypothetical protein